MQVPRLADTLQQVLRVVQLLTRLIRKTVHTRTLDQHLDILLHKHHVAHGDEGHLGGLGMLDKVFPAVRAFFLKHDRWHILGHKGWQPAQPVARDKRNHVVF